MGSLIECRVTVNLDPDTKVGDHVLVDPDDPRVRPLLDMENPFLVPVAPGDVSGVAELPQEPLLAAPPPPAPPVEDDAPAAPEADEESSEPEAA
jgi:hypothetical protein